MNCIIVFLLLSLAFASSNALFSVQYTGSTNNSLTTAVAATSDGADGACTPNTDGATSYETVTITFPTAGAYFVYALFSEANADSAMVNIYTNYTPSTPCTGNIAIAASNDNGAPNVYVPMLFQAATYTFVITQNDIDEEGGPWALHVYQANFFGDTQGQATWWNVPDIEDEVTSSCFNDTDEFTPYIFFNWTQATTGFFDINVFSSNNTFGDDFVYVLYNTSQPWVGTGTMDNPANPCQNAAGFYMGGDSNDDDTQITDGFGQAGVIPNVLLTTGIRYTLVISSDDQESVGVFGARISPTIYFQLGGVLNYASVGEGTDPADCTSDVSTTMKAWSAFVFTAQWPTYLISTGPGDIGFDAIAEFYVGNNAGVAPSVAPLACTGFLQSIDTDDGALAATGLTVGANYTVVITSFDDIVDPTSSLFTLWVFTGNTTGGVTSTSGSTSGVVATTSSSASATTNHVTTSGSASATTNQVTTNVTTSGTTAPVSTSSSTAGVSGAETLAPLALVALVALFA